MYQNLDVRDLSCVEVNEDEEDEKDSEEQKKPGNNANTPKKDDIRSSCANFNTLEYFVVEDYIHSEMTDGSFVQKRDTILFRNQKDKDGLVEDGDEEQKEFRIQHQ